MSMTSLSVAVRLCRASIKWNTTPRESRTYRSKMMYDVMIVVIVMIVC